MDEGALDVKVPRITLQPIVENAYVHGLQNLERPGEIHLNVKSMKENIIIEIIDNGMGMDEDTIQKYFYRLQMKDYLKNMLLE
ncbi:sensor histidine kinase [Caloramator sp. Dgby_cultured_2]|uniref:sensor histidine kinase n=1 Tax=Caloramator sp. Dgby_cultured_2 TaxID=3029174 RepID=UPI003158BFA4